MKKIAVIPARYASTRFPAKLMQMLGEKTIIKTTYNNTVDTGLFDDVLVVTDSEIIYNEIRDGNVMMSKHNHESGSDRIAEAVAGLDCDVIINVQGDEPFVDGAMLEKLLDAFANETVQVASVMHEMFELNDVENPNNVKVVLDNNNNALLFSRSVIPFARDKDTKAKYFKHIGIYGYRKPALLQFTKWPAGKLEMIEKLEQLRYLENGVDIKMIETAYVSIGIDTPQDLELAKQYLAEQSKTN